MRGIGTPAAHHHRATGAQRRTTMDATEMCASEGDVRRQLLVGLAQDLVADALRDAGYPHPDLQSVELLVDAAVRESLGHYR